MAGRDLFTLLSLTNAVMGSSRGLTKLILGGYINPLTRMHKHLIMQGKYISHLASKTKQNNNCQFDLMKVEDNKMRIKL